MTILANAAWQVPVLPLRSDSLWCLLWRPSSSCGEGLKHSAYHSLHFMFPWVSSVQANKLQRWQADFCLTGQQARREGGKEDYRNFIAELIPQVTVVHWGIPTTYHKDQNPYVRLIPEKNLQIWTPLLVPLTKATRKIFTAHYTCILPSLILNPNWVPFWNKEIQV